jgi:hypothetical protein
MIARRAGIANGAGLDHNVELPVHNEDRRTGRPCG